MAVDYYSGVFEIDLLRTETTLWVNGKLRGNYARPLIRLYMISQRKIPVTFTDIAFCTSHPQSLPHSIRRRNRARLIERRACPVNLKPRVFIHLSPFLNRVICQLGWVTKVPSKSQICAFVLIGDRFKAVEMGHKSRDLGETYRR